MDGVGLQQNSGETTLELKPESFIMFFNFLLESCRLLKSLVHRALYCVCVCVNVKAMVLMLGCLWSCFGQKAGISEIRVVFIVYDGKAMLRS